MSIRLELFISPKLVLRMSPIFSKQTNDSYRFISELMDFSVWLVFTSNLNSQTSWLKVKFKLVEEG